VGDLPEQGGEVLVQMEGVVQGFGEVEGGGAATSFDVADEGGVTLHPGAEGDQGQT
jgi:hypothetical protein